MTLFIEHVVGLDHGNGWVKAKGLNKSIVRPSYIGEASKVGISYSDVEDLKLTEYTSKDYKNENFVWGDDVKQVSGATATYSQNNRYKDKYYQLVSLFAIYECLGNGKGWDNVLVVTGVPSNEKGSAAEQELKDSLLGLHCINNKKINIVDVIVLPQPLGTVMSLYLDDEGYIKDPSYQSAKVGVGDVGTGTTDLDVIQNLRRLDEFTSIPYGMMDVFTNVEKHLKKKGLTNIEIPKIEEGWKNGVYVQSARSTKSFGEHKAKAIEETFKHIKEGINLTWKDLKQFDKLIITGGGADTFRKHFDEFINDIYDIPKNPQFANVEGFYNYGKYVQAVKNDK